MHEPVGTGISPLWPRWPRHIYAAARSAKELMRDWFPRGPESASTIYRAVAQGWGISRFPRELDQAVVGRAVARAAWSKRCHQALPPGGWAAADLPLLPESVEGSATASWGAIEVAASAQHGWAGAAVGWAAPVAVQPRGGSRAAANGSFTRDSGLAVGHHVLGLMLNRWPCGRSSGMLPAEDLARAALQGFFGTPEFRDMQSVAGRRRAVRQVADLWAQQQAEEALLRDHRALLLRQQRGPVGRFLDALARWW